jgi:tRNA G18 (ribose-2'-O)-methylase SpoU
MSKLKIEKITTNNLHLISEFTNVRDKVIRGQEQAIAESPKVVSKLLKSNTPILKILASPEFYREYAQELSELDSHIPLYQAQKEQLKEIVGYKHHSGVMALVEPPQSVPLAEMTGPIVIYNGVSSPENVGCIVRTMVGLGIHNLIIDEASTDPYIRRCIRVSMGNVFRTKIHYSKNIQASLNELKQKGHRIIVTSAQKAAINLNDFEFKSSDVIVFGSEGHGVTPEVLSLADKSIFIPIDQQVSSFNVATAAGIILYQFSQKLP